MFVEEKELVWLESDSTMGISKMSIQNQVGCRERVREGMGSQTVRAVSTMVTEI